jgi:hypothetical protein
MIDYLEPRNWKSRIRGYVIKERMYHVTMKTPLGVAHTPYAHLRIAPEVEDPLTWK